MMGSIMAIGGTDAITLSAFVAIFAAVAVGAAQISQDRPSGMIMLIAGVVLGAGLVRVMA